MAYRLGVDIGGTFTDIALIDEATGQIYTGKVSSTPQDPSGGFMEAVQRLLAKQQVAAQDVAYIVHGTTVATNAIIEGKVAPTGFITTEGFRDMLEIARQIRPTLYDLQFEKPRPLVPRHRCFGVPERLDASGAELTPLDESVLRQVAGKLRDEGVESIAVCFLHAYANPTHERRAGEIIAEVFPEAVVSLSAEVAPEFREYLRASTTVINSCIRPVVARYLQRIEDRLAQAGIAAELLVMQSSGGVYTFAATRQKPVYMVESGPAAGVIAAAHLGQARGYDQVISFDMGGTTAKAGLIQGGAPSVTKDYEVGTTAQTGVGATRGAGYPIRTPVIDLVEIGAGGGSIAWVDPGGILRVGPQSAGADPGPVCYGQGGTQPTVTDANLVLGRLNPSYFLGGEIALDPTAAQRAIEHHCAQPLGMDLVEAAHGIVEIANTAMVNALRLVSVQRGYDPRDFALVAFGGAGPAHAIRLAALTEIPVAIIPQSPGTASALGLLVTDLKHDYATTHIQRLDQVVPQALEQTFRELEAQGRETLGREGMAETAMDFRRQADLRYVGQSHELTLPLTTEALGSAQLAQLLEQFHRTHDRAYGFSAPGEDVELVSVRLSAIGQIAKPALAPLAKATGEATAKGQRPVYFAESEGFVDCPVYDRYALGAGAVVQGPAIVEEIDSTTVVHPQYQVRVDEVGQMVLTAAKER
ncbi:MAG: hydantoinase/oxoprolinase family protein [Gemmatimonadetes bacterium]|nr:hydantoinase/oxoprolinase family protein [Gemmatimonadota bacterium]